MRDVDRRPKLDRRRFLRTSAAVPVATIALGAGMTIDGAWADTAKALAPETMRTLVKVARDIYPHDHIGDAHYIAAAMPWDEKAASDPAFKAMIEAGVARLDDDAKAKHKTPYGGVQWEADRVAVLRAIETTPFFQKLRSDLVVALYNQHDLWAKFGYEGASAPHGGYIHRGFDDVDWLPKA